MRKEEEQLSPQQLKRKKLEQMVKEESDRPLPNCIQNRLEYADAFPMNGYRASIYLSTAKKVASGKTSYVPSESERKWAETHPYVEFGIGVAITVPSLTIMDLWRKHVIKSPEHKWGLLIPFCLASAITFFSIQPIVLNNFYTNTNSSIGRSFYRWSRDTDPSRTPMNQVMEDSKAPLINLTRISIDKKTRNLL
eukprot:TRINITY_DN2404_c0_g3_i2.p1 TRINITY_DN2404_c0_g3~~TRINITY_DN2404_c0_g3_i2.p1  ORF type:complete len:194 (+),score=35.56 TRINITY_DN2404_c0_g3_i2:954-1535(+)